MRITIPSRLFGERSPARLREVRRRDFVQTMMALAALPKQGNWKSWRVNGSRVNKHLTDLAQFGANPQGGVSRVAFSGADVAERGYRNRHPLHVVIWCDEESGLTGSRGFIGDLPQEEIDRPGRDGVVLAEKIRRVGGDPGRIAEARHGPGSIAAYIELHIEQGGILDERGINIGIVEGIVGIHHYDVTLRGFANHAGTTPMDRRQNAMLAAAELVLIVDRVVRSVDGRQVGTVGRLLVKPGAPNVIPGQVDLTVELRDLSTEKIERLWTQIHEEALASAKKYGVTLDYTLQHTNLP